MEIVEDFASENQNLRNTEIFLTCVLHLSLIFIFLLFSCFSVFFIFPLKCVFFFFLSSFQFFFHSFMFFFFFHFHFFMFFFRKKTFDLFQKIFFICLFLNVFFHFSLSFHRSFFLFSDAQNLIFLASIASRLLTTVFSHKKHFLSRLGGVCAPLLPMRSLFLFSPLLFSFLFFRFLGFFLFCVFLENCVSSFCFFS